MLTFFHYALLFSLYQGGKIHATVRKQLLYLFESKLEEEKTYQMSLFYVAPGYGSYRTTLHPFKLVFQMKTKVKSVDAISIPVHGITITKLSDVCAFTRDYDYLVGG